MNDDQYLSQRLSSWDAQPLSTNFYSSRPGQNVSSISMPPPTNAIVPYSKYNSPISSQSYIDERQMQQYQQARPQAQGSETLQLGQTKPTDPSQQGWCAQHLSVTRVIGLLIGLIAAGIPLAVIVTLYLQLDTSSSNSATTTGAGSTTVSYSMPYQCTSYTSLSDSTRLATYYCGSCYCDSYSGWYRFTGSSGTQMVTSPVSSGYCGANYPGWFNGTHPTTVYTTAYGTVCVYVGGNICTPSYSISVVPVTNCGGFYVYYLTPFNYCYSRYCTM